MAENSIIRTKQEKLKEILINILNTLVEREVNKHH